MSGSEPPEPLLAKTPMKSSRWARILKFRGQSDRPLHRFYRLTTASFLLALSVSLLPLPLAPALSNTAGDESKSETRKRLTTEERSAEETRELRDTTESRESQETRESNETRETRELRES